MPPKSKLTKDEIIQTAFQLTREFGFNNITARQLAKELRCSTQPIFYIFKNMEELKAELYIKTRDYFTEMMSKPFSNPQIPLFLNMGLTYVELAQKEKHLFQLLCMSDSFALDSLYQLAGQLPSQADSKLFTKIWLFTHGIASIVSTNRTAFGEQEVRELLIEAFQDFAHFDCSSVNSFSPFMNSSDKESR